MPADALTFSLYSSQLILAERSCSVICSRCCQYLTSWCKWIDRTRSRATTVVRRHKVMSFQLSSRNSTILASYSYLVILKPPRFETEESECEAGQPSSATTEDAARDQLSGTLAPKTPRSSPRSPLTHGRALRPDFLYLRERPLRPFWVRQTTLIKPILCK